MALQSKSIRIHVTPSARASSSVALTSAELRLRSRSPKDRPTGRDADKTDARVTALAGAAAAAGEERFATCCVEAASTLGAQVKARTGPTAKHMERHRR